MSVEPQQKFSNAEVLSILFGLMLAMLLGALDQTIVATAMPTIGRELGNVDQLPWVVTAYLLASVAVTPLYGKLSDIYGRRIILLVAIATFMIGSIACALSRSVPVLAVARGLQGAGGGGLIALAQTIIADIVSPRERGRYQVHIASVFVTSSLAGPVLGGFLAEHIHWSAIFWINLPLGAAAYAMTSSRLRRLPQVGRKHGLDILGAVLLICATSPLLLALSWGGVRYAWFSGVILGLFAAALAFGLAFVWRTRVAEEPLIPATVLGDQVVKTATMSAGLSMGVFVGLSIVMPVYLEGVVGLSASMSGIALIPLMIGTVAGSTIAGRTMSRVDNYKIAPLVGMSVALVAIAIIALRPRGVPLPLLELLLLSITVGLGTVLPTSTVSIQNAVPRSELGAATATSNFFRQIGSALVAAIFGAIVFGNAGVAREMLDAGGLKLDEEAIAALVISFRHVYMAAFVFVVVAICFFWAMELRPLRSGHEPPPPAHD
ncbi:MAG: MFS transporter [Hyphomicrobiales bacterium]|nr:MFS transporter [Hyphomicrobiales bacterium]